MKGRRLVALLLLSSCWFPGDPLHYADNKREHRCPKDPEGKPCDPGRGAFCTAPDGDFECVEGTLRRRW
jgi:hypothetical protein